MANRRVGLIELDQYLAGLEHPFANEIEQLRREILAVDDSIQEGIKWNTLSFRTTEWFATLNTRSRDRVEFVFHLGAKVRDKDIRSEIPHIPGHLTWKSHDRCLVSFGSSDDIDLRIREFRAFISAWITHV